MRRMARLAALVFLGPLARASWSHAEGTWFDELIRRREAPGTSKAEPPKAAPLPDSGKGSCTFTAWIRATSDGSVFAETASRGKWVRNGKALFVKGGRAHFDVGWAATIKERRNIIDGKWHHVAFAGGSSSYDGVGTVIRLDMTRDIRTRDPMTHMTPYVDVRSEGGSHFRTGDGQWRGDRSGRAVPSTAP
jgi:hypothetical protein